MKTIDIREVIKARLVEIGRTPNWLAQQQTAVHEQTARSYLYEQKDTTGRVIGEMLAIVGLAIVPEKEGTDDVKTTGQTL